MDRIETDGVPIPVGPYSQAIRTLEGMVFVSGQLGLNREGNFSGVTIEEQTRAALQNILAIVEAAGGSRHSIVKITAFLKDIEDYQGMNKVFTEFFEPPYPARSCIGGCILPKGALIEIEAIARL